MSDQFDAAGGWNPCEPGTISEMVAVNRTRRRVQLLARTTTTATLVVMLAGGGFLLMTGPAKSVDCHFGGISCTGVKTQLGDYQSGRLDAEVVSQVETHLASCSACREWLKKHRRTKTQAAVAAENAGRLAASGSPGRTVHFAESSGRLSGFLVVRR